MVCRVVGREARWNEGCRCHGDCHVDESHPYPKRRRLIGGRVCEDECPWKGRHTVEHVLGRVDILSGNLQQARSEKSTQLLGRMKEMDRHKLLPAVPRIVASIVEELRFKLKFYREYPWVLLEVLAPLFGGSVEQSESRAADALVFYDAQVQTGKRPPRGFKELFDQGASFRSQLELYATTSLDLNRCVIVLTELLAYALAPTQERDLEAEHGRICARQKKH